MTGAFSYDITFRMNFRRLVFPLIFCLFVTVLQADVPNVVYLSFDGVSPHTLTVLMRKKKVANFNKMSKQGGMSILKGVLQKPNLKDSLAVMWTGYPIEVGMSRHDSAFVFNRLKKSVPDLTSVVIISRPKRAVPKEKEWGTILKRDLIGVDVVLDEKERTSDEVSQAIIEEIRKTNSPFILFANYPLAAQFALTYREGCGRYAEGVLYLNKQLGLIQEALKEKGVLDNTVFVLTASYTFIENTQMPSSKSWVICSKPIRAGKSPLDLVPTIYDIYGVSVSDFTPKFSGTSLLR